MEILTEENKSLKATVFVVGVFFFVCLLPLGFFLVVLTTGLSNICPINEVLTQTFDMLNCFLIHCFNAGDKKKRGSLYLE